MKLFSIFTSVIVMSSIGTLAQARNPFEPPPARTAAVPPVLPDVQGMFPLAPLLPPPAPPSPPSPRAERSRMEEPAKVLTKSKAKESESKLNELDERAKEPEVRAKEPASKTRASCNLKAKSTSLSAPARGGAITLALEMSGGKECLSAVLSGQSWLEVKDISNPSAVQLDVAPNEGDMPRHASIILANAAHSITVVVVQQARVAREK